VSFYGATQKVTEPRAIGPEHKSTIPASEKERKTRKMKTENRAKERNETNKKNK
jgi:hypothetical protein